MFKIKFLETHYLRYNPVVRQVFPIIGWTLLVTGILLGNYCPKVLSRLIQLQCIPN